MPPYGAGLGRWAQSCGRALAHLVLDAVAWLHRGCAACATDLGTCAHLDSAGFPLAAGPPALDILQVNCQGPARAHIIYGPTSNISHCLRMLELLMTSGIVPIVS